MEGSEPPVFYTPFEIEVRKEPVTEPIHNDSDPKRDDPLAQFRDEEVNSEDHVYEEEVKNEQAYTDANRLETENTVEDLDPIEIEKWRKWNQKGKHFQKTMWMRKKLKMNKRTQMLIDWRPRIRWKIWILLK